MKTLLILLITIAVVFGASLNDTFALIANFSGMKHVKFAAFFVCWKKKDILLFDKIMSGFDVRTVHLPQNVSSTKIIKNFDSKIGVVVDLSCANSKEFLLQASHVGIFQIYHKWLIINKDPLVSSSNFLEKLEIRMDSDITYNTPINDSNKTNKTSLYDIYNPGFGLGGHVKHTEVGFSENGQIHTKRFSWYEQRRNMAGVKLKVGVIITHNFTVTIDEYLTDRSHSNRDSITKLNYNVFKNLHWIHKFDQQMMLLDKWFGRTPQGNDSGSLCQIMYEGKLDYSMMAAIMTAPRTEVIQFLKPTYNFRTCFIFRNPGRSGSIQNEFLKPFHELVWYLIFVSGLIVLCVLKATYWIEENLFNLSHESSLANSILIVLAAFCQQGSSFLPKYFSGRLVVFSLLILSLIIYNYYTSSIVSSLLSVEPPPWKTLMELAHSSIRVGVEPIIYATTLLEVSTDPDIRYLYKTKIFPPGNKHPFYYPPEEGIALAKKGGFAYHTEPSTGYPIIKRTFEPYQICELNEINLYKPTHLYTLAPKKSQFNKLFAITYTRLIESGIVKREQLIWQTEKPKCLANLRLSAVGINHAAPLLILLCAGMLCSILILLFEVCVHSEILKKMCKKMCRLCAVRKNKKQVTDRNVAYYQK